MTENSPFHDSRKLMRCQVANRYQETSIRFIELDAFKLWEYLMTTKHGQRISDPTLCLWVDAGEYKRNASVFDRAGEVEPVSRIVVDLFDRDYGFSQTITRYARERETERVVEILRSHIPPALCTPETCQIDVIAGQVVQHVQRSGRGMLMGLEG